VEDVNIAYALFQYAIGVYVPEGGMYFAAWPLSRMQNILHFAQTFL
jgi:hypothetical protein